ncbi:universal stress protein [Cryobacterium psychrophilum]|uniref:Universal stress protein n=1 Tax=Cryobacterium psychrophilum TaxID=41988 RepID=A0A4Y8KQV0_9MICO|nr:universal stress protein [Cryobacterium psychrophilum]TDW30142.1 nucleotide-binding universal stress UspA family protein [Cryobacterium psychrophilum]TFD80590.1 universal stress protein [Cryobacterium psychrophilum]
MSDVILVAVNDSPAAFAAVTAAIDQATGLGARLHAVMVVEGGEIERHLAASKMPTTRRQAGADAVLMHVVARGLAAGLEVTGVRRSGRVAAEILEEARGVGAIMIVMGRVERPGHLIPFIGSHTLRVLEFTTVPVLVVPLE